MEAQWRRLAKSIDPMVLGPRIKAARLAVGKTQGELVEGRASGAYLSRVEAGLRRPDPELLEFVAERVGVPVEALLSGASADRRDFLRLEVDYAELELASGSARQALDRVERLRTELGEYSLPDLTRAADMVAAKAQEALGSLTSAIEAYRRLAQDAAGLEAIEIAIALSRCLRESGQTRRAIETGEAVLARLGEVGLAGSPEAVQLALTVAAAYFEHGDRVEALELCQAAVAAAEELGSDQAAAAAYWNASVIESHTGQVARAVGYAQRALALMAAAGSARHLARLRSQLGTIRLRLDPPQVEQALADLEEAGREMEACDATRAERLRNRMNQAHARLLRGDVEEVAGVVAEAQAVAQAARAEVPRLAGEAEILAGRAQVTTGDVGAAEQSFRRAVLALTAAGADRTIGQVWFELAGYLQHVGAHAEALAAYRAAGVAAGYASPRLPEGAGAIAS